MPRDDVDTCPMTASHAAAAVNAPKNQRTFGVSNRGHSWTGAATPAATICSDHGTRARRHRGRRAQRWVEQNLSLPVTRS
jgi:hypothetical protein